MAQAEREHEHKHEQEHEREQAANRDKLAHTQFEVEPEKEKHKHAQAAPSGKAATGAHIPEYLRIIGMDPRKYWPKKYRFTREKAPGEHQPLTIAQRNFYETNGYIVLDECVSKRLLDAVRAQHEGQSFVNEFLVEKMVLRNAKLLQYVKCFCDEQVMLMTHRLVESFQTSEVARQVVDNLQISRQQLFRDWVYLPFRPIDKVVCVLSAIDQLDHVVLVVPGTHRVGQVTISSTLDTISAAYGTSDKTAARRAAPLETGAPLQVISTRDTFEVTPEKLSSLIDKAKRGFKYVNLKPGQTLFYHPGLVHGFSQDLVNFRKSQLATIAYYAAADCEYVDSRTRFDEAANEQHGAANEQPEAGAGQNKQQKQQPLQQQRNLPIGLAHFHEKDPADYTSWLGKPRLLSLANGDASGRANL